MRYKSLPCKTDLRYSESFQSIESYELEFIFYVGDLLLKSYWNKSSGFWVVIGF